MNPQGMEGAKCFEEDAPSLFLFLCAPSCLSAFVVNYSALIRNSG
jgi:hypothetical protein